MTWEDDTLFPEDAPIASDPHVDVAALSEFQNQPLPTGSLRARVTPLDEHGRPAASWTVVVVELDERTIAFNHLVPITARNIVVTFEKRGSSTYSVEVELTWCRFAQPHQYTSGGRFILPLGKTA